MKITKRIKKNIIVAIFIFFFINITTIVMASETTNLDCEVKLTNISQLPNVISIISNANSENTSITVSDSVKFFKDNGITVQSIQSSINNKEIYSNESNKNLLSTDLVGTDWIYKTNKGDYTSIVYGDATGDGQINAADISIIINHFLGTKTDISQASKVAGDIQQDEALNAADMALMINSFLGNLEGNILKPNNSSIESSDKKLSEVVKVGDYVDYPVEYKTPGVNEDFWTPDHQEEYKNIKEGWRVFKIEGDKVYLVSNLICFRVDLDKYENQYSKLCTDIRSNFAQFTSSNDSQYGGNAYLNSDYATNTRALNSEDVEEYLGINVETLFNEDKNYNTSDDLINIKQMYGLWKTAKVANIEYIFGANFHDERGIYPMGAFPFGVRTVVELKDTVLTTGKDSNNVWKLKDNN